MHTIDIYGGMWGVGLWWQNLEPGEKPKKKVKSILLDFPEYNSYVIKLQDPKQIGFGKYENANIPRVPCLAPALVSSIESESFIGWFRISNDTVWVVAVTENAILADVGDFLGSEKDAKEIFDDLEQIDDAPWQDHIYYYDNIDEALDKLAYFVDQSIRPPKLKPAKIKVSKKFIIILLTILVLSVSGYYGKKQYDHYLKQEELKKQRIVFEKKQRELEQKKKVDIDKLREKHFPNKWEDEPFGGDVLSRCINKIYNESIYENDWVFVGAKCDHLSIEIERERMEAGNFTNLPSGYKINVSEPNTVIKDVHHGNDIRYPRQESKNLKTLEFLSTQIYELARVLKANIKLDVKSIRPKTVELGTETKIVNSPYDKGIFSITIENNLPEIDGKYINHTGLIITNVEYNGKNWVLEGEFYIKR